MANGGVTRLSNLEHRKSIPSLVSEFTSAISFDQCGKNWNYDRYFELLTARKLSRLPRQLRNLWLPCDVHTGDLSSLLPNLTSLRVHSLDAIPSDGYFGHSLLDLRISWFSLSHFAALPPTLLSLDISVANSADSDLLLVLNCDFRRFSQLGSLTIRNVGTSIPQPTLCPPSLTQLHLYEDSLAPINSWAPVTMDMIPSSVLDFALFADSTELSLTSAEVAKLNRQMTFLTLHVYMPTVVLPNVLSQLPPTLRTLEIVDSSDSQPPMDLAVLSRLPPGMTALCARFSYLSPPLPAPLVPSLPNHFNSLKTIDFVYLCSPCNIRAPLPPSLTSIRIGYVDRELVGVIFANLMDSGELHELRIGLTTTRNIPAGTPISPLPRHLRSIHILARTTWFPLDTLIPRSVEEFTLEMDAPAPPDNWLSFTSSSPGLRDLSIIHGPISFPNLAYLRSCSSLNRIRIVCTGGTPLDILSLLPPSLETAYLTIDDAKVNWDRFVTNLALKLPKLRFLRFEHSSEERFTPFPPRLLNSLPKSLTQFYLDDRGEDYEMKQMVASQLGICVLSAHHSSCSNPK